MAELNVKLDGQPMLRSANYLFRPFAPDDAPDFAEAVHESASSVGRWMPWAHKDYSLTEAQSWIAQCQQGWEQQSSFEFGIFDSANGRLAGGCGLNQLNKLHGYCNLGYWVRDSFHRRGVATEAIRSLSDFAFNELMLGRVEIAVAVGNLASLGAAKKAGAHEEGTARNRIRLGARFIDAHVLSLVVPA